MIAEKHKSNAKTKEARQKERKGRRHKRSDPRLGTKRTHTFKGRCECNCSETYEQQKALGFSPTI